MRKTLSIIGMFLSLYASSQITYDTYCYSNNGSTMMQAPDTTSASSTTYCSKNMVSFSQQMYLYALIADGKVIDTKRMILTK